MRTITIFILLTLTLTAVAQETEAPSPLFDLSGQLPEIDPEVERRDIIVPKLESLDLELGVVGGVLSVEDFGANYNYGIDATFHLTEDFFLLGALTFSRVTDRTYRKLNLPLFGQANGRDVQSQNVALGWNFLQGEMFWLNSLVVSSSAYILLGGGVITFDQEDYFQWSTGMGMKFLPKEWLSFKAEARFMEYESSLLGYKKYGHNMGLLLGIGVNFW